MSAAVLIVDQISSATAMVFPIAALVELCRDRGVPIVVDGAHAPGLIDAPAADGADFWTGNFHKWPASPRATAGLVVAEKWRYGDAAADRVLVGVRRAPAGAVRHAGHVRLRALDRGAGVAAGPGRAGMAGTALAVERPGRRGREARGEGARDRRSPRSRVRRRRCGWSSCRRASTSRTREATKMRASRELKAEITLTGVRRPRLHPAVRPRLQLTADYEELSERLA